MDNELLYELREQGLKNEIPIIELDALVYIGDFLNEHNIKTLLEVGTAIGYSSIGMCTMVKDLTIETIEIDEERYQVALKNIEKANLQDRIICHLADARKFETDKKFDVIFLDGPKAHNEELLNHYLGCLNKGGYIIVDDVYFHGFLDHQEVIHSKRLMTLVKKFKAFRDKMENSKEFDCTFLNIGDGLLIAQRKEDITND